MGRGKRDRVAELFESANMMTLNASGIELVKVVSSEIRVRFLLPQDMVNDHQQTVGDGDNGLLSPSSSRNAMAACHRFVCSPGSRVASRRGGFATPFSSGPC